MKLKEYQAKDIFAWRKFLISKGANKEEIDWLLDMGGGLSWSDLQKLYLDQKISINLERSLEELQDIWNLYIEKKRPLQHSIGRIRWREFELEVSADALIPRQETELLVDFALEKFDIHSKGVWADLGTGSGAIAVALAHSFLSWEGHAVDCSMHALSLAQRNLNKLSPNSIVTIHLGNWWEPLKALNGSIDLVLANPPYIPADVYQNLDPIVRDFEPKLALWGGEDGLDACRELVLGAITGLKPGGWLIFEHHHDQSEKAMQLMCESGFVDVLSKNDFKGFKRFLLGRRP